MTAGTIFLSAADPSGDEHAARLVKALLARRPQLRVVGVGGEAMQQAGCEVLLNTLSRASMGGGPLLAVPHWYRMLKRIQRALRDVRPEVHVPVDSPALNWHVAAAAKAAGAKVFYYIAPQVWAWGTWRVDKLRRLTDHVACILPFEERYLRDRGVAASFVGHPLLDDMPPRPPVLPDITRAWADGTWRVVLLPGSRSGEIRAHVKALMSVADAIRRRWSGAQCTVAARTDQCAARLAKACERHGVPIVVGQTRAVLAQSHFAVATSGTVTLEVANFGVPMVVFYKVPVLNYALVGRWVLNLPHLSLVNILAGWRLVPEIMPWYGNTRSLARTVLDTMYDLGGLSDMRKGLLEVVDSLRLAPPATASDNAAAMILDMVDAARAQRAAEAPR